MEIRAVNFKNGALKISANIYLPEDFDESKKYTGIVCVHPIGSCKEQTAGNVYATRLAENGFVALAFDATYQGDSAGEPRYQEFCAERVEDISCAVDYLQTLDFIDDDNIGVLGICGGGGYVWQATMIDKRIKACVSITGANFGRLMREGFTGKPVLEALEEFAKLRKKEAQGKDVEAQEQLPKNQEQAKLMGIDDRDVLEAVDYYNTPRGENPNGKAKFQHSRLANAAVWDATAFAETLLTQPLLVVIGDQPGAFGAYRDGREIFGKAASKRKEILELKGVTHYDLYDQPGPVSQAMERVLPFFNEHLQGGIVSAVKNKVQEVLNK